MLNGTVGSGGATGGGGQATGLAAELNAAAMSASNTYGNGERGAYEKEAVPISEMHVKKGKELVGDCVVYIYIYVHNLPGYILSPALACTPPWWACHWAYTERSFTEIQVFLGGVVGGVPLCLYLYFHHYFVF